MGELFPLIIIIVFATIVTGVVYTLINKILPIRNQTSPNTWQRVLFFFVMFYTPIQLLVLVFAGHRLPIGNTQEHLTESVNFALLHGVLACFGMVVSMLYRRTNNLYMGVFLLNTIASIFYFMSGLILLGVSDWLA